MPSQREFVAMENSLLLKIVLKIVQVLHDLNKWIGNRNLRICKKNWFEQIPGLIKIKVKHFLPHFILCYACFNSSTNLDLFHAYLILSDPRPLIQYSS